METPSSARRVTRSQTMASASGNNNSNLHLSRKIEESEKTKSRGAKKQQQDRSALIDITNDSPIVGLAMGSLKTPSSAMSKKKLSNQGKFARTPGSGEALLRGQVKTLLQKVEEEAELSKITLENRPIFNLQDGRIVICSPINLVAPTPANTPQVLSQSSANADGGLPSLTPSAVFDEKFLIPQIFDEKSLMVESEAQITRSLLLDFSEKSEKSDSCSSVLTYQGAICGETESSQEKMISTDDDDESIWSIQVNASSTKDDEEEEEEEEEEECEDNYYYYDEEEEYDEEHYFGDNDDGVLLDELCDGISKISVKEGPKFEGKHIRFVYNSDDEIVEEEVEEEEVFGDGECESPTVNGALRLKGLPTPKGKHLRFAQESEDN